MPAPNLAPSRLLADAGARFRRMSRNARIAVVAAVLLPVFAFAAIGAGDDDPAATTVPVAGSSSGSGNGSFLHGATAVLSHDLDRELERIAAAGPASAAATTVDPAYTAAAIELMQSLPKDADGNPDWARVDMEDYARRVQAIGPPPASTTPAPPIEVEAIDLDEALDLLADKVDEANPETLDALRDSVQGSQPHLLIAHSLTLMVAGDPWGAVANLLVAHEQDDEDATPLVNLAAIANGQNLPAVALALLDAADELEIGDDDSPVGIAERAARLNNRGHALLLLRRYDDAEAPLQQALALSPELSEAARNLVHALVKLGREDEARALLPRAVWRLRGDPARPVPVRDGEGGPAPAEPPPATGSPEQIARWVAQPWLETAQGNVRLPLWIALDLSKQGQVAWPEPLWPVADASYGGWFEKAAARYVASHEAAAAFGDKAAAPVMAMAAKRFTTGDHVNQAIAVMVAPPWSLEAIDTEMHRLQGGKESLILGGSQPTRFQALSVARAEYAMEEAADRLYERYRRDSTCPAGSSTEECCAIERREVERNIAEMTPIARGYEEQMRVFFRDAYGLSTAIASNLPPGPWHDSARATIEQQVQLLHWRTQQELGFAFTHAAPPGGACYGPVSPTTGEAPDVAVDAPACSAASQWASGKYAFSDAFSMEVTCGKIKFVAEVNIIGTKKLKWGPLNDIGADLGMHAEIEFSMEGTVTIFAGPKAGVSGKIGEFGGDFGVKDGIYAVIGKDGVQDVGMRVVIGGGVGAGSLGGTHDVDSMDFSFVSAL